MTKKELVEEVKKYFGIKELVSEQVYKKYGEAKCWAFFDTQLLETLLVIRRDILGIPLTINNWASKGSFGQRGLRANKDPMVVDKKGLYLSAHVLGSGVDFSSSKMSAKDIRKKIKEKQDLLPYPIRLEDDESAPTWVHIDVATTPEEAENKITYFSDK